MTEYKCNNTEHIYLWNHLYFSVRQLLTFLIDTRFFCVVYVLFLYFVLCFEVEFNLKILEEKEIYNTIHIPYIKLIWHLNWLPPSSPNRNNHVLCVWKMFLRGDQIFNLVLKRNGFDSFLSPSPHSITQAKEISEFFISMGFGTFFSLDNHMFSMSLWLLSPQLNAQKGNFSIELFPGSRNCQESTPAWPPTILQQ